MDQKLNTSKPGCPKRAIYEHLNFELQKKLNKYYALCLVCSRMLTNIATKRLIAHRRCCPKTNKYDPVENLHEISIIAQNDDDPKSFLKHEEDPFKSTNHEVTVKSSASNKTEEWRTFRIGGKSKHTSNNVQEEDNDDYMEQIIKKQRTSSDNDDVDYFFKSIALSVKKLSRELINEAKLQTLQMVLNLESKNNAIYREQASDASPPNMMNQY